MSNELTHNPGQFDEVIHIIDNARSRAMKAVNAELIQMYWEIGSYVSGRVKDGGWGKSVVADFSDLKCEASAKSRYCTRMRVQ
jgi:hypothetical protein